MQDATLLNDVTEVDETCVRHDLIHVVDPGAELVIRPQVLNRQVASLDVALHILLVRIGMLCPELALQHVGE